MDIFLKNGWFFLVPADFSVWRILRKSFGRECAGRRIAFCGRWTVPGERSAGNGWRLLGLVPVEGARTDGPAGTVFLRFTPAEIRSGGGELCFAGLVGPSFPMRKQDQYR